MPRSSIPMPRTTAGTRQKVRNFGTSLLFNGTTDYITLTDVAPLNITGDISFTVWVKTRNTSAAAVIVGGYNNASGFAGYGLRLNAGKVEYWSGTKFAWVSSTNKVNDGQWHHIGVTVADTVCLFYIDGVLDATTASNRPNSSAIVRRIGGTAVTAAGALYSGYMDDVRIYATALTGGDITNSFNGWDPSTANLRGYWKFDEGSGTTATDTQGNSNGVITSATYTSDVFTILRTTAGARTAAS